MDRIQSSIAQVTQPIVVQADAAGNEVSVKLCFTRPANQVNEIMSGKWFASRKTDLQNTKRGSFTNDPFPFLRRELAIPVAAVLRAARSFTNRSAERV